MKLLFYEMKKSWFKIPILLMAIVFGFLNVYKINENYRITSRFADESSKGIKNAYYQIHNEILSGKITDEKINFVINKYNDLFNEIKNGDFSTEYDESRLTGYVYGDYSLFKSCFIAELEYAITYTNFSEEISHKAYENIEFFIKHGNNSDAIKNQYIYNLYKDRHINYYNPTDWVELYFNYDFSSLLIIVMIICGLSNSFPAEGESGMLKLILANGKARQIAGIKLANAILFILLLTAFFTIINLITINTLCKIDGLLNPVYSAGIFKISPFNFSLLSAIIICEIAKILGYVFIAELIILISALLRNTIAAICSAFALCIGLIIGASFYTNIFANPINMLTGYNLIANFDCIIIFGNAIHTIYFAMAVYILAIVMLTFVIKIIFVYFRGR